MTRSLASLLAILLTTFAVAGCGGDDEGDSGGGAASEPAATTQAETAPPAAEPGGAELKADADPSGALKFEKDKLVAKAGKVTITMANPSPLPHAVSIRGGGLDVDGNTVEEGGTSTVTADLKPGKYEFYCPVPGHDQGGMKGDLTVK